MSGSKLADQLNAIYKDPRWQMDCGKCKKPVFFRMIDTRYGTCPACTLSFYEDFWKKLMKPMK